MTPGEEHKEHEKSLEIEEIDHKALMYLAKGNKEYNKELFSNQWEFFGRRLVWNMLNLF